MKKIVIMLMLLCSFQPLTTKLSAAFYAGKTLSLDEALFEAIHLKNPKLVNDLLEAGAKPNIVDGPGWTPLLLATNIWNSAISTEITIDLLGYGAEPNVQNGDGWTPLHIAANRGCIETVRALVNYDADPTIKNKAGKKPIDLVEDQQSPLYTFLLSTEQKKA